MAGDHGHGHGHDHERDALAMIREVNPDVTPEGEILLPPDKEMRWIATPLAEQKLSAGFPTGDGRRDLCDPLFGGH